MKAIWEFKYRYFILPIIWLVIRLLAFVSRKVRRGIRGRKGLFVSLETQVANKLAPGQRVWFHASSLGEFEQAKPIIAELKRRLPEARIIVTFFSPSGFEHSKKFQQADVISYIPFDTRSNARRFLDTINPTVAVIIRYDVWPNHIWELQRRNIPILIANATMRQNTRRRLPLVRNFHHYVYNAINDILTVSKEDVAAFKIFGLTKPVIEPIGDTRYDQVSIRSSIAKKRNIIAENILTGKKVLVAGSTWPEDEEVLLPTVLKLQESFSNILFIIAPHEPTVEHLEDLESELQDTISFIRFSALNDYKGENVIIVDSIGILLALYAYAHVAYVGGSFRQNVHNVLEAAVYGIPVVFGPKHTNSQEAVKLAVSGGGFMVENANSLHRTLYDLLDDEPARKKAGEIAASFVRENTGATDRFLDHLQKYL